MSRKITFFIALLFSVMIGVAVNGDDQSVQEDPNAPYPTNSPLPAEEYRRIEKVYQSVQEDPNAPYPTNISLPTDK